jgi:hypothetical protein
MEADYLLHRYRGTVLLILEVWPELLFSAQRSQMINQLMIRAAMYGLVRAS